MRTFLCFMMGIGLLAGCEDGGDPTGGSAPNGVGGATCNGEVCGEDELCVFEAGACDGPRSCQPLPDCPAQVACGCDGVNYAGPCVAMNETGGVIALEACEPPPGKFTCTYEYQVPIYCNLETEYCHVTPTGDVYFLDCEPLPRDCTPEPQECTCLSDPCSENYCGVDQETGAVTVLCPFEGQ